MTQDTILDDSNLDKATFHQRTTGWGNTKPATNWPVDAWFFEDSTNIMWRNSGVGATEATPVWVEKWRTVSIGYVIALGS